MIPFKATQNKSVSPQKMQDIYNRIKTPVKLGAVMKSPDDLCDSPTVFRYNGKWYMSFIKISKNTEKSGYDSHLAVSDDLVNWQYLCPTLKRNLNNEWDSKQIALYSAFVENELFGEYNILNVNGSYYFSYLGGNLDGYETDPLMIGQCKTTDITDGTKYEKIPHPRLKPTDTDVRQGETLTLYKSYMFKDECNTTGYPYVCAYNAKGENHKESIFLAVSNDGETWERYGEKAVIYDDTPDNSIAIIGDPQILKFGDVYIMLYFVSHGKLYNTFACSYDLVNWTKWHGEPLITSTEEWENVHAHKPWLVTDGDKVYHYYCAMNDKGERFIALATN